MRVAVITDTHFGARKGSKLFHDYFEKFFEDIFFPSLKEEGITTLIHMGDAFDVRKGIDFKSLEWAKRVFFNPLREMGITMHLMCGNHDAYYKNTNDINSNDLLLNEYDNVFTYSSVATEVTIDKTPILFIPWINDENREQTLSVIENSTCEYAMGHLELNGFRAHRGCVMDHGADVNPYQKFNKVFSGHYHTRSDDGKIYYLGNPYEMFWNDVNDTRGFVFMETDDMSFEYVNNPYHLFYNVYYEDTPHQMFDATPYHNKIIKVIVKSKSDAASFEKFIDKLYDAKVADLKIIENYDFNNGWVDQNEDVETEDTFSILNRYIEEAEFALDKSQVKSLIKSVYEEACELV